MISLWFKAFHIISMVTWFAGLFYIFRLFVYHVKYKDRPEMREAYQGMEWKLLYTITHPAGLFTIVFGALMLWKNPFLLKQGWMHLKLLLVLLLLGYQIFAGIVHKRFRRGDFFLSERSCRIVNEVPTLLLIGIVLLTVLKP